MRLLAAVDLGEAFRVVVETARFLQEGLGLPAELLHVVPTPYLEALGRRFPDLAPRLEATLGLVEEGVREALAETGLRG